jgi:hypothetical protein
VLTAAALLAAGSAAGCGVGREPAGPAAAPAVTATNSRGRPTAAATRLSGQGGCTRAVSTTSASSGQISAGPFLAEHIDAVRLGQAKLWVKLDPPPPGNPGATVRIEPLDPPGRASVQVRRQLGFLAGPGDAPFYPGTVPVRQHGPHKITVVYAGHTGCFLLNPPRAAPTGERGPAGHTSFSSERSTATAASCRYNGGIGLLLRLAGNDLDRDRPPPTLVVTALDDAGE